MSHDEHCSFTLQLSLIALFIRFHNVVVSFGIFLKATKSSVMKTNKKPTASLQHFALTSLLKVAGKWAFSCMYISKRSISEVPCIL